MKNGGGIVRAFRHRLYKGGCVPSSKVQCPRSKIRIQNSTEVIASHACHARGVVER